MASISYPRAGYNGGAITSVEHERLTHCTAPDGILGNSSDTPMCYADGTGTRTVKIRANRYVLVRGSQYDSGSSEISLTLGANSSGNPRIDLIVLRLDRSGYTVTETVIAGTPAASPTVPAMAADTGSTGFWDFPLAQVAVANGATTITAGNVTPLAWYTNQDGQILCTASTRPQHHAGRRIFQTDTGFWYFSDGTTWKIDGVWTTSTLVGSNTPSVTFSNIPTNLKKLEVHWTARDDWAGFAAGGGALRVNHNTSANYRTQRAQGSGDSVSATANQSGMPSGTGTGFFGHYARAGAAAGIYGSGKITFPAWNAPHTNHLAWVWESIIINSASSQAWSSAGGGIYAGAGPYNRLDFYPDGTGQNWVAGTQFTLYGWE